ncbi:MAG: sugar phosphate isomerase/epimerase [Actinomycetota bacterium]|nr:sugar phosphate isomerase/epimerase [Actinomycetota bacterium]
MATEHERLRLGTAPDSWGVWFPDDPAQVPWHMFLDEAAGAGYQWIELGPCGYLPTDPGQLRDELGARGLQLSGGAVFAGLHRGADALQQAIEDCRQESRLLTALGARHLVLLPEGYTDLDGNITQPVDLEPHQWSDLTSGMDQLAKVIAEEFDVSLVFHPHADSHVSTQPEVERFLADTDPDRVSLCLDTGHISYCGGDNIELIGRYPKRIGYVHLKQVDPEVLTRVEREKLCFAEAVRLGAMTEPPNGIPAMEPLIESLAGLDVDLFTIVEQDLYPCEKDVPFPIAKRTHQYLGACGLGPGIR